MRRFGNTAQPTAPAPRRTVCTRSALVLPVLAPVLLAVADVSSLSLSSPEVTSGGSVTGTVTLSATAISATAIGATAVTLASSNTAVATVPSSVSVSRKTRSATFQVSAAPGAVGCTQISAKAGSTPARSQLLFVQPASSPSATLRLSLSPSSAAGGNSVTGTVSVLRTEPGGPFVVQLSSNSPNASVPASVTVSVSPVEGGVYVGSRTFTISTSVVAPSTCAVITATLGGQQRRALLKLATISG